MSRYDHKIETSLEGIEHLSKEKKGERERKEIYNGKRSPSGHRVETASGRY